MTHLANETKISKFLEKTVIGHLEELSSDLLKGQMGAYESRLWSLLHSAFNYISDQLLPQAATQMYEQLVVRGKALGGRKAIERPVKIRLSSGHQVQVSSPYIKQLPEDGIWQGSRHMVERYWQLIGGASPGLYSKVGYCSALGPSYELASQTLSVFGIQMCTSSVRDLTNELADYCHDYGEDQLMLGREETLAGKRVVIGVDGGRTRTRQYDGQFNAHGNATYDTAWNEPKVFVIDVLDDQGQPHREELPIYGSRFAEQDLLQVLEDYLRELQVDQARQVQIVADGAAWIWNRMHPMLVELGLAPERIVETLDYYHASKYIHDLVQAMPKRIGKQQRQAYLKQFKDWLWQGKSDLVIAECGNIFKRPSKLVKRWIEYFFKHQHRTQYADFEKDNLMCGSGIIESGIRRIINLRFKNAATFWDKHTVEKLFCLRAAMLSKRWNILMNNIAQST